MKVNYGTEPPTGNPLIDRPNGGTYLDSLTPPSPPRAMQDNTDLVFGEGVQWFTTRVLEKVEGDDVGTADATKRTMCAGCAPLK